MTIEKDFAMFVQDVEGSLVNISNADKIVVEGSPDHPQSVIAICNGAKYKLLEGDPATCCAHIKTIFYNLSKKGLTISF